MPVDRTHKKFKCEDDECTKAFSRLYDLRRHEKIHGSYEERPFPCTFEGCPFRANQRSGLKCHVDSIHKNLRLACGVPECDKTFSDPSSRSKHRHKFHCTPMESTEGRHDRPESAHKRKHSAPYSVSVHARVARHVEEHSRQDAKDVLNQFATFALGASTPGASSSSHDPSDVTTPSASHCPSSVPSSSTSRRNCMSQSTTHCELPGVFNHATDVPTDCWSIDKNKKLKHQRPSFDANHPEAAPMPWGCSSSGLRPLYTSTPRGPTFHHPSSTQPLPPGMVPEELGDSETRRWDGVAETPIKLAPLRGQWMQGQSEPPFKSSYPSTNHVPPSDVVFLLPPIDVCPAYRRPHSQMLFNTTPGIYLNR